MDGENGDVRPTAYIIVLADTRAPRDSPACMGAATENMLLAAWAEGVGSCWSETVDREQVAGILGLPAHFKICWAIALGYPAEQPAVEEAEGGTRRWRDQQGRLVVQKRPFDEVIHIL
jgi:nitroreductase